MNPILIACYTQMLNSDQCTVDDILEDPNFRNKFLGLVRASITDSTEREILHGLTNLRKSGRLPRGKRAKKHLAQVTIQ